MVLPPNPTLGDYCKWFEVNCSPEVMMPLLPVIIRLDGANFHNWTKGLERPFDHKLIGVMQETTRQLVTHTNATIGYTQSDEITLVLYSTDLNSTIYHDGKKSKILSKLAAYCSVIFNDIAKSYLPDHGKIATFDARIFQVPNLEWAYKQLLWREKDAVKNSISMLAQHHFHHNTLQGLNRNQLQEKLFTEKGVNWNSLPNCCKRGTYFKRKTITQSFVSMTPDEISLLPPMHNARNNPESEFERNVIEELDIPILSKITDWETLLF